MRDGTRWAAGLLHWFLTILGCAVALAASAALAMGTMAWLSPEFQAELMRASAEEGVTSDLRARVADGTLFAMVAAALLLSALLIWLLWRIIGRVRRGDPFAAENPRDIYYVAGVLAVLEAGGLLVRYLFPQASACGGPSFDVTDLLPILMAVVLAEVFREGNRLRDDAAGTV